MKDISKLIPIKKPVIDIQKGLIVRTYYYKPEKLVQELEKFKEEPNINYFTVTPFYDEYENYIKTGDISQYSKIFPQDQWKVISKINKSKLEEYNENTENSFLYKLSSLMLTGEKIFTKGIKQESRNYSKEIIPQIEEKIIKPKKKKSKNKNNLQEIFNNDNNKESEIKPKVKYKIIEEQYYNVTKTSNLISNIINFYNPKKPKLQLIVKSFVGSDFIDESMIAHHLVLSERSILRIPETFLNILKTNVRLFENPIYPSRIDMSHLEKYLPYYLIEIFKINPMEFKSIINTYSHNPYISEIIEWFHGNELADSEHEYILYAQIVALPKKTLNDVLKKTIFSVNKDYRMDYTILKAVSIRKDTSVIEFDNIMYKFLSKYKKEILTNYDIVNYFIDGCFNNSGSLLFDLLQLCISKMFGKHYIPLGKDFRLLDPEVGSILFLLSVPNLTLEFINSVFHENFEKIKDSKIKMHIPVISKADYSVISGEIDVIPFRLFNFHMGIVDTSSEFFKKYHCVELEIPNNGNIYKLKDYEEFAFILI